MSDKINAGLFKTKKSLAEKIMNAFTGDIDDELYDDMIEALILSDIPFQTAERIMEDSKKRLKKNAMSDLDSVKEAVRESIASILEEGESFEGFQPPAVVLVMGVNGVGKTTSIAKMANLCKKEGKKVMLAAADTFRAAAGEQLKIWAERLNVPIVSSETGQDAASVIYDAIESAKAKETDVLICDTAGRLHNKKNLMEELSKIFRVCEKASAGFRLYTLVVLDAMTGQNSINQLKEFSEVRKPDGVVITKLDGSAKGGVVVAAADVCKVPVFYVGVGEGVDDLVKFDSEEYARAII